MAEASEIVPEATTKVRKFDIRKELNLGFLGEAWKECKLILRPLSGQEMRDIVLQNVETTVEDAGKTARQIGEMIETVKEHFIEGTGVIDGKIEPLIKEDIHALPAEVTKQAYSVIAGVTDPNSQAPSKNA